MRGTRAAANVSSASATPAAAQVVLISARKSNIEAMLLAFIAINRLPMATASGLLDLVKSCAADQKALNDIRGLSRTATAYKLSSVWPNTTMGVWL
jgi:hypothetical protein